LCFGVWKESGFSRCDNFSNLISYKLYILIRFARIMLQ
jgi:hypothetical protein